MGQINTNNYPTVDSLADADLLIVENATHGTGTTTPKQLRENAIGTDPLQTTAQTVTGAVNELKSAIDAGSDVKNYDIDTISSGYLGEFDGKAKILLLHLTTDGTADATDGYTMLLSYTRPVARLLYGQLVDTNGFPYMKGLYADTTVECLITTNGTGTESDPRQVLVLGVLGGYVTTGWNGVNALGERATAEGAMTDASGDYSHAGGYQTTASGNQSTAMGYSTTASADGATAMGNGSTASGANSIAGGYNTTASGAVSTAMGTNTQATQQAQVAMGKYNKTNNDALLMVGNGTAANARKNALEVLLNGDVVAGNELIDGQGNTLSVLAEALTKTVSGNPIVITDALPVPAKSLKTTIEAIQDLHGYDHPWAGGADKNKFVLDLAYIKSKNTIGTWNGNVYTVNGGTITIVTDNDGNITAIKVNGTFSGTYNFVLSDYDIPLSEGTYIFTCDKNNDNPTGVDNSSVLFISNINGDSRWRNSSAVVGDRTFTITDTSKLIRAGLYVWANIALDYTFYPMIRLSSEQTGFAPYSNVCPISGRTEARVDNVGHQLWNEDYEGGAISAQNGQNASGFDTTRIRSKTYSKCIGGESIYAKIGFNVALRVFFYASDYSYISYDQVNASSYKVITVPANAVYFKISTEGTTYGNVYRNDISVNTPSSFTDYVAYQHSSATIQLGQTVYGAEVDFDTGVVSVTHGIKAIDAEDMTYNYSSGTQRISTTSLQSVIKAVANTDVANIKCSCFIKDSANGTATHNIDGSIAVDSTGVIYIYSSLFNDASTFKTAMSGQTICYELATPTTLQLTPAQLELLKGYNRVSIESGSIELGYIAKLT